MSSVKTCKGLLVLSEVSMCRMSFLTMSTMFFLDTIPEMRSNALSLMESSRSSRHSMIRSLQEGTTLGYSGGVVSIDSWYSKWQCTYHIVVKCKNSTGIFEIRTDQVSKYGRWLLMCFIGVVNLTIFSGQSAIDSNFQPEFGSKITEIRAGL